ncbi:hypothetical protein EDB83DRAFT_2315131 [Lactarius deliciosus]|nr:hypothetical protein EDB83DRAFT_2315131 [Lactarius deliciosus]
MAQPTDYRWLCNRLLLVESGSNQQLQYFPSLRKGTADRSLRAVGGAYSCCRRCCIVVQRQHQRQSPRQCHANHNTSGRNNGKATAHHDDHRVKDNDNSTRKAASNTQHRFAKFTHRPCLQVHKFARNSNNNNDTADDTADDGSDTTMSSTTASIQYHNNLGPQSIRVVATVAVGRNQLESMMQNQRLQPHLAVLGPNHNQKSGCLQLRSGLVAVWCKGMGKLWWNLCMGVGGMGKWNLCMGVGVGGMGKVWVWGGWGRGICVWVWVWGGWGRGICVWVWVWGGWERGICAWVCMWGGWGRGNVPMGVGEMGKGNLCIGVGVGEMGKWNLCMGCAVLEVGITRNKGSANIHSRDKDGLSGTYDIGICIKFRPGVGEAGIGRSRSETRHTILAANHRHKCTR